MRISTRYQYDSFSTDIRNAQQRLTKISEQLSTGKRINQLSDDPSGVRKAIGMRSLRSSMDQYEKNLTSAKGQLGYVDTTAGEIGDLLLQAYQSAVQGASSATDQTGRVAMASRIESLQSRLVELANTKGPDGGYLFAGQKTATKPYVLMGSTLTFNGDSNATHVETGPGETLQTNVPTEPMITEIYSRLESLKSNLIGGQVGAISGVDIAAIQDSQKQISTLRGTVGARLQKVDELKMQWQRRSDELTISISDVEDVDFSEAAVQYQQASQAYTAALTVASQGFRLSLMDFIK
jgi:flagellar hook-associated protein 3 FlgL